MDDELREVPANALTAQQIETAMFDLPVELKLGRLRYKFFGRDDVGELPTINGKLDPRIADRADLSFFQKGAAVYVRPRRNPVAGAARSR